MKNIFIEGIQGMGKTTLLQELAKLYPELHVCREGDYSPVELAYCTWMTEQEYLTALEKYPSLHDDIKQKTVKDGEHYVVSYTKIITDEAGFHKYMEQYEIYNGRKPLSEFENIISERYETFAGTNYLFECSIFQNIIEELILFHMLSDDEIIDFYKRLYGKVNKNDFVLLYLHSNQIEESTEIIRKERADERGNELWYPLMLEYFKNSPYGKRHGCEDFNDLIAHFRHRQQLELRIMKEIIKERAVILPAKEWDIKDIINAI